MFNKSVDECIGSIMRVVDDLKLAEERNIKEGTKLDIKAQEVMGKAEGCRLEANMARKFIYNIGKLFE